MSDESTEYQATNGRVSNNDLLRDLTRTMGDLAKDVQRVCVEMAGMRPQLDMMVKLAEQTQTQISAVVTRTEGTERDLITVRNRLESLETRPVGISPEDQGEIRQTLREHTAQLITHERRIHDDTNRIQELKLTPPLFNGDETTEIRRLLKLAIKFEVDDGFTRVEMDELHDVVQERQSGQVARIGRHTALQNALIGAAAGGFIFGFVVPFGQNLLLHWH